MKLLTIPVVVIIVGGVCLVGVIAFAKGLSFMNKLLEGDDKNG